MKIKAAILATTAMMLLAGSAGAQGYGSYANGNQGALVGVQTGDVSVLDGGVLNGGVFNGAGVLSGNGVANGALSGILNQNQTGLNLGLFNDNSRKSSRTRWGW